MYLCPDKNLIINVSRNPIQQPFAQQRLTLFQSLDNNVTWSCRQRFPFLIRKFFFSLFLSLLRFPKPTTFTTDTVQVIHNTTFLAFKSTCEGGQRACMHHFLCGMTMGRESGKQQRRGTYLAYEEFVEWKRCILNCELFIQTR